MDIHADTARTVFEIASDVIVTRNQRAQAKLINQGLLYGYSPQDWLQADEAVIERARIEALYGVKMPDRCLAVRIDRDELERELLDLAVTLRPVAEKLEREFLGIAVTLRQGAEQCVESLLAFGKTLAGIKAAQRTAYNARLQKRTPRYTSRRINGRLRPLTALARRKKEKRRERVQDRSGSSN